MGKNETEKNAKKDTETNMEALGISSSHNRLAATALKSCGTQRSNND